MAAQSTLNSVDCSSQSFVLNPGPDVWQTNKKNP
jgi:hypothetical protein